MVLQFRRAKTDWSGCCQMTVQGDLWLAKCLSLNLNFSFLKRIRYFWYQVATQLSSRSWVDPVPDPILPEKFLGYSRESNPGPLGWQSGVLTTIPNRWSWKDDYECQMIFGDIVGLKLPDIFCLIGEEKRRKILTQETCPDRGSNPGPLRGRRACYRLLHCTGQFRDHAHPNYRVNIHHKNNINIEDRKVCDNGVWFVA